MDHESISTSATRAGSKRINRRACVATELRKIAKGLGPYKELASMPAHVRDILLAAAEIAEEAAEGP